MVVLHKEIATWGAARDGIELTMLLAERDFFRETLASLRDPFTVGNYPRVGDPLGSAALPAYLSQQPPAECLAGYLRLAWAWRLSTWHGGTYGPLADMARGLEQSQCVPVQCAAHARGSIDLGAYRRLADLRLPGPGRSAIHLIERAGQLFDHAVAVHRHEHALDGSMIGRFRTMESVLEQANRCLQAANLPLEQAAEACPGHGWLRDHLRASAALSLTVGAVLAADGGCEATEHISNPLNAGSIDCAEEDGWVTLSLSAPPPSSRRAKAMSHEIRREIVFRPGACLPSATPAARSDSG